MQTSNAMQLNIPFAENGSVQYQPRPPRTRTCMSGKLVYGEAHGVPAGSFTLDCMIRNISEGGANVIIAKYQYMPPKLYLIVVKSCVAHYATVVWQHYPARGLKFSDTYALNDSLPGELKYLRTLWGNLYAKSGMAS